MKQYARELTARLPKVAPEFEYAVFSRGGNFGWSEQVALPFSIARSHVDLVHLLSLYTPLIVPAKSILTIHDLIHLHFPKYFKVKVGIYYRTVVRRACARAERVITDDERTVEDLERFLGVNPRKVRVIPLGVDPVILSSPPVTLSTPDVILSLSKGRPYFLYVGNHRRHKNLRTLLAAWQALPERCDVDLLFTGPDDFDGELQRASSGRRRAEALGDVPLDRLAELYRDARALVHPALREGFGLPLLEAMASGTPVVASADAIPRVLEPAALSFPAEDVAALTARLLEVLDDEGLRDRLVNEGRMLARHLTWDRCARATADVYREVLA
jgi:alpha-1,3-rhamnosyl/mannosyltransferase